MYSMYSMYSFFEKVERIKKTSPCNQMDYFKLYNHTFLMNYTLSIIQPNS